MSGHRSATPSVSPIPRPSDSYSYNLYKTVNKPSLEAVIDIPRREFCELANEMLNVIKAHLDLTKTWTGQEPEALQLFREQACTRCPLLTKFEACWPIELYAKKYLIGRAMSHHKQISYRQLSPQHKIPQLHRSTRKNSPIGSNEKPPSPHLKQAKTFYIGRQPPAPSVKRTLAKTKLRAPSPGPSRPLDSQPKPSSPMPSTPTTPTAPAQGEAVRAFLRSLPQDLEVLLPHFMHAGITDALALRALAGLPGRYDFLYSFVTRKQMGIFHIQLIDNGLDMLTRGAGLAAAPSLNSA